MFTYPKIAGSCFPESSSQTQPGYFLKLFHSNISSGLKNIGWLTLHINRRILNMLGACFGSVGASEVWEELFQEVLITFSLKSPVQLLAAAQAEDLNLELLLLEVKTIAKYPDYLSAKNFGFQKLLLFRGAQLLQKLDQICPYKLQNYFQRSKNLASWWVTSWCTNTEDNNKRNKEPPLVLEELV